MKRIYTMIIGLAIVGGLLLGVVPNVFSATISFNLEIANPAVAIFRLENTSPVATTQITDFSVTIGDTMYNFDLVTNQTILSDTGSMLEPTLVEGDTSHDGVRTDQIQYSFTGFDPTDRFSFNADIDQDSANTSELFDQILFNNGSADNAIITVSFVDGLETGTLSFMLPDDPEPKAVYTFDVSGETVPFPDSDGDGVIDQWDVCPNTPPSSYVNMQGCRRRLEGDFDDDCDVDGSDLEVFSFEFGTTECPPYE